MFIKYSALLAGGLAASVVSAASLPARNNGGGSGSGNSNGDVSLIITFGDSYTDNCNTWRDTASPQNQSTYAFPKCPRKFWLSCMVHGVDQRLHVRTVARGALAAPRPISNT